MGQRTGIRRVFAGLTALTAFGLVTAAVPPQVADQSVTSIEAQAQVQTKAQVQAKAQAKAAALPRVRPAITQTVAVTNIPAPLPTSECLANFGIHCYSPLQFRKAYNLEPLYRRGINGAGRTIVLVEAFGSPTLQHDLDMFDAQWGLPHTTVEIDRAGTIPPFDPNNGDMVNWAFETTLDVQYAHAIAPGAHIIVVETPVAQVQGTTGLPEMMNAEKALIDAGKGDVISQSFTSTENTFPGFDQGDYSSLLNLRYAFKAAERRQVTVLASSGDHGVTNFISDASDTYPFEVNAWPASDPLVTAVGGTALNLDDSGARLSPDTAWNDVFGATGGAKSTVFGRPAYQFGVRNVVGSRRGTPDISMTGAVDGGGFIYASFLDPDDPWQLFGGTSLACPLFAAIVAMADQMAGHRLGDIHNALYVLGAASRIPHDPLHTGIVDVTIGDNSSGGVTGHPATKGYDLATGWGTIDAAKFIPALVRADR
jgi:subtilase family serine protease